MNNRLRKAFQQPSSLYRSKVFWAWNGELEPDELRRQVRVFHRMGLGGFFMHARIGLATEYLSSRWFECVSACVDEAAKLNMEAWLYDEDRWPSGSAGGRVTRDPRYRMRYLALDEVDRPDRVKWDRATLAVFSARLDGMVARDVRPYPGNGRFSFEPGHTLLRFRIAVAPESTWYNGQTYLDTMNPEAVQRFITLTHERYRRRFGEHLGRTIPGIFMDEPNHGACFFDIQDTGNGRSLPWTPRLPEVFAQRYGYDLIAHLPELFFDVENKAITPARHDFHDCLTDLFANAFTKQIGQWCENNGLLLTGHVLMEESPSKQTIAVGSVMRSYEHMQVPGLDLLTQYWREFDTAKQVSSAARQFGKKWRLTETYGCTGWDFPLRGHKALGDWQVALGINMRCPHLAWYTMLGSAKRDYPASISYQSPWWESYSVVEDYFARLHLTMSRGREVRDLLVIHPVESAWVNYRQDSYDGWNASSKTQEMDGRLVAVRDSFLAGNIDFDYGDEDILRRHGKVSRAQGAVRVGRATYKAVVVPPLLTIRRTTLNLLKRFRIAGGLVVFAGKPPTYVDARPDSTACDFAATCVRAPVKGTGLVSAVEAAARRLSITDRAGREIVPALHLLREDRGAFYLFVCNAGHDFRKQSEDIPVHRRIANFTDVRIRGFEGCQGRPIELDPNTGESLAARARKHASGCWTIHTSLPLLGSRLFVIPKAKADPPILKSRPAASIHRRRKLDPEHWAVTLSEPNNVTFDAAEYRLEKGRWRDTADILKIDHVVREQLRLPHRGWNMAQPWANPRDTRSTATRIQLRYRFRVKTLPEGDVFLGIEQPDRYRIEMNGHAIANRPDAGWWIDPSLRRLPIDAARLRKGANELTLSCKYDAGHPGLEAIHLLGSFGVRLEKGMQVLVAMPVTLTLGDWTRQGLLYYSGSVTYSTEVCFQNHERCRPVLVIGEYEGSAIRLHVDNEPVAVLAWPPYEFDLSAVVSNRAACRIGIEVLGHRRNSHGPLHLRGEHPFIGPEQFEPDHPDWTDDYVLVPVGLMKPPRLEYRG